MDYALVVSRALFQSNQDLYRQIEEQVTPMLSDIRYIADIYCAVKNNHPTFDETDTRILFTAIVYDAYCPASFLPKAAMKLPIGVRDEAARVLGYSNPENINSWKGIASAYIKGREFRKRVDVIKDLFRQFSVRKADWQLAL